MKKLIAAAVTASFLSTSAFGQCTKPVTLLNPGDAVPCTGYLFTPEQELKLRLLDQDYKFLDEKLKLSESQIENYKSQVSNLQTIADKEKEKTEMWRHAAEDSTQKLITQKDHDDTKSWLMVLAGVGLTVAAGWAIGQAHK